MTSIQPTCVTLADGTEVAADYILVATGLTYASPFKPSGETVDDSVKANNETSKLLADAKSVVIVGAGAVGEELAGEIATAQPDKRITQISSDASLFPAYPAKMGQSLIAKLEGLGVTIVLGQRVENLERTDVPYAGSITLTDGTQINAGLIFPVVGSKAQTELLSDLSDLSEVKLGTSGRVKTD